MQAPEDGLARASALVAWGRGSSPDGPTCTLEFDGGFSGPVYLFYKLENYFQSDINYIKSVSLRQLHGEALGRESLDSCRPVQGPSNAGLVYYPCGLIADSVFNDTFRLRGFSDAGISWRSDRDTLFARTSYEKDMVRAPPSWRTPGFISYDGKYIRSIPDISENEHLMVWMRTSAFSTFLKLYSRREGDLGGKVRIRIVDNFPASKLGARKSVLLSTSSWFGGTIWTLPVLLISFGVAVVLVATFLVYFIEYNRYRPDSGFYRAETMRRNAIEVLKERRGIFPVIL